ncbi:SGNH/GDSL hydrolase family protein [Saccharothrix violaceirubra]|uniref:Lysophospholipase L1-like esterase n=1 Tax=Saccharothrix violaceirubra TaxID=413306 RepID=A0A7W7T4H0_9PSEU|nr:GDSL-type esterase/lipase family protein [Saccharothrix violaceirubra]MBB4966400.1 lysophospholipase L1-like esterase [Saccharothrix violaceirubra]
MRVAVLVGVSVVLAACTGGPVDEPVVTSTSAEQVYVSVGDSYATGYRPADVGNPAGSSADGFAYLVGRRAGFRLVNVACSGATSAQVRQDTGCAVANRAVDAPEPAATQLDAAVRELRANRGRVGLVTVVIGGNDLSACVAGPDVLGCVARGIEDVRTNLAAILTALREAAGDAPIVGLTYPDVFLGAWVSARLPDGQALARTSVPLFRDVLNPALSAEYGKIGAKFVDVTAVTGGYDPLDGASVDTAYGPVPDPVAKVCTLTYFCAHEDVHPTPAGHETIASAVLAAIGR